MSENARIYAASDETKPNPGRLTLRPERTGDEAFLFEVYASTREEELAVTGWDEAQRQQFLAMQFAAMTQGYRRTFPAAEFSIILRDGKPVGRVVIDRAADEIRIVDMALLPESRGQGSGSTLVRNLQEEAARVGKPLRLRTLIGRRSSHLCERFGFRKIDEAAYHEHWEWRAEFRQGGSAG